MQVRRRWWHGAGSPGFWGYVVAVVVSAGVLGVVTLLGALPDVIRGDGSEDLLVLPLGAVLVAMFALIYAVPLAPPGVLLVHLLCLRVRHQVVHVLAAGLAGAGAALVWVGAVDAGSPGWFPFQLAVATACGRAAVVPLARRRQAARRPVDDDSRDGAARC